ncbi:hypothetical protein [Breznakiella homolactica]|uniref:dTDP-4-amino-4,6-dideoxygalactose transaminase n=1 Tax=Breznakiella homolactica TaxID=2798577 RepID=A0A7T8BAH8_9SPIR|nr:hypothetical protein [Breznakiella homolactica]QQO09527.1 hypothetical protein JFL75_00990 [Breznakiella homolactica]
MKVGGMFCLESTQGEVQDFPGSLEGDLRFFMSGRCGIYYSLLDLKQRDEKLKAYLPAYTCETVIDSYVKAGYSLRFYDVSPELLTPVFDEAAIPDISVLNLCGYYGFSSYSRDFVRKCSDSGAAVLHDITHSVFSSDGIDGHAAYAAGSLRKWMGIPSGGIAVKRRGQFTLPTLPPEEEHIAGRIACFETREKVLKGEPGATEEAVGDIFWKTELRLRRMFDVFESDETSKEIIAHYPYRDAIAKRRENFRAVLERNPFSSSLRPVFPDLPEGVCPSHFPLYAEDRDRAQEILGRRGIKSTVYWPVPPHLDPADYPGAEYIYAHILSVPVDQRYSREEMDYLCDAIAAAG